MRREYDIFERFPDGSSIWRATIPGRFEAQRKMQEFAEHSENTFFTIDIRGGEHLSMNPRNRGSQPAAMAKAAH